jgi:hypothetical protein
MHRLKQLAIASAVAATFAATAHGQSTSTFDPQTGIRSGTAVFSGNKDDARVFEAREEAARLQTRAVTDDKGRPTGAVMYLADSNDRANGRVHVTEAQRAAEHARYEANKRRVSITASEQARARIQARPGLEAQAGLSVHSRVEIGSSELARSGITASERATAAFNEQNARAVDRAAASQNAGASDDRRARDILSDLR